MHLQLEGQVEREGVLPSGHPQRRGGALRCERAREVLVLDGERRQQDVLHLAVGGLELGKQAKALGGGRDGCVDEETAAVQPHHRHAHWHVHEDHPLHLLERPDATWHELALQCGNAMYARDPASKKMGILLCEIRPGTARMEMKVTASMANGKGICHGGYLFSLADTTMAFASNSRNEAYVAVSASIEFLDAGRIGDTMTAIAIEEHRAGRTATRAPRAARAALQGAVRWAA